MPQFASRGEKGDKLRDKRNHANGFQTSYYHFRRNIKMAARSEVVQVRVYRSSIYSISNLMSLCPVDLHKQTICSPYAGKKV